MVYAYPEAKERDMSIEATFEIIQEAIIAIRRAKFTIELSNQTIPKAYVMLKTPIDTAMAMPFIARLAKVESLEFVTAKPDNAIVDASDNLEVYLPTDSIDLSSVITKIEKQKEKLQKEIEKLSSIANNEKAPEKIKAEASANLATAHEKINALDLQLVAFR
jgi:valyl-tRNA synthetase